MNEPNMQQATDELRTLNEAEIEAVSGAKTIDMGYFGKLARYGNGCVTWTMEGEGYQITRGNCPKGVPQ